MKRYSNDARALRRGWRREVNKTRRNWESLEENEHLRLEGGIPVVKGVSKRIIVVKSPDPKIFEQAIFIVREDYPGQTGVSEREALAEARQAAFGYLQLKEKLPGRLARNLRAAMYAVAGAAATTLAWIMVQMIRL